MAELPIGHPLAAAGRLQLVYFVQRRAARVATWRVKADAMETPDATESLGARSSAVCAMAYVRRHVAMGLARYWNARLAWKNAKGRRTRDPK